MYLFKPFRFSALWTWGILVCSVGITLSASVYLRSSPTPLFLLEKGSLRFDPMWRTSFYFHVAASLICLAIGPLLMFARLIRFKRFHKFFGYLYFNVVLWVAAPTGMLISFQAKGGVASAIGFLITGVAWWLATWNSYQAARMSDSRAHAAWALRSYSLALGAIYFRLIHQALGFVMMDNRSIYIASVWLSLVASVVLSEWCIARLMPDQQTHFTRPLQALVARRLGGFQTKENTKGKLL